MNFVTYAEFFGFTVKSWAIAHKWFDLGRIPFSDGARVGGDRLDRLLGGSNDCKRLPMKESLHRPSD